jgi:eukaryotic-like serine/threonine-protein kinase
VLRARMRAEAQLAGALVHPGVARVYDYGEDDADGEPAPYIVMQYVEGTSLWALLRERRTVQPEQVMDLVAQTASALEAAHEAGIVHRDIKPSNMLVTEDDRVVLVDFGIARTLDAEPLTATGTIVGTADYISPEQVAGQPTTTRSDIYSLGLVAYECLSGHRPFHRESSVATALAHLHDPVPALGEDVPVAVRRLVAQMVAKDPDDRPTASEVTVAAARLHDLAITAEATQPILPPPPSPSVVPAVQTPIWRSPSLRSRRLQVGSAAVVVALAVSFVAARPSEEKVPDLTGDSWSVASEELSSSGLDAERRLVDDPAADRGTVVGQDPPAGTTVDDGSSVEVQVASGRTSLAPEDVAGLQYDEAARALVQLGLVPARRDVERPGADGSVVTAAPYGRMPIGSVVTLAVGVEPAAPTPAMTSEPAGHAKPPKPEKEPKPPKEHGPGKGHKKP